MKDFLTQSMTREGAESMITPREIIRDYVTLLDLLYTNPDRSFSDILGHVQRTSVSAKMVVRQIMCQSHRVLPSLASSIRVATSRSTSRPRWRSNY